MKYIKVDLHHTGFRHTIKKTIFIAPTLAIKSRLKQLALVITNTFKFKIITSIAYIYFLFCIIHPIFCIYNKSLKPGGLINPQLVIWALMSLIQGRLRRA